MVIHSRNKLNIIVYDVVTGSCWPVYKNEHFTARENSETPSTQTFYIQSFLLVLERQHSLLIIEPCSVQYCRAFVASIEIDT
jgi:hypothetical protein